MSEAAQMLNQAFELGGFATAVNAFERDEKAARFQAILNFSRGFVAAFEVSIQVGPATRAE